MRARRWRRSASSCTEANAAAEVSCRDSRAGQPRERAPEVLASVRLQAPEEARRPIDGLAAKEPLDHSRASLAPGVIVHPRVLRAHGLLVAVEDAGLGTQNGEVDVNDESGVRRDDGWAIMGRGHHQAGDARDDLLGYAACPQGAARPGGAPGLVVVRARVVDNIVEPERSRDLGGALRGAARLIEELEARPEVLHRMVGAVRFPVGREESRREVAAVPQATELPPDGHEAVREAYASAPRARSRPAARHGGRSQRSVRLTTRQSSAKRLARTLRAGRMWTWIPGVRRVRAPL